MTNDLAQAVRSALAAVNDPVSGRPLDLGMIQGLLARDGMVHLALAVPRERARDYEPLRLAVEKAAQAVPGVLSATVVLTAHRGAAEAASGQPAAPRQAPRTPPGQGPMLLPSIGAIIAVASGKGGVGKSTTAVNLAAAMAASGLRTGLLDADVHGPSLPRMLGSDEKPASAGGRILPIERWGLKAMSIGFMIDQETPVVWRGPMVMGALEQMLSQVEWGTLDVLVVDMPPGTGDAQLTMSQRVPLRGAVIVSTPQDIALIDARRGIRMFEKVNVPILGLIENMSYFCCPNCNHRSDIFGHGGAKAEAERLGAEFLGELPLKLAIRETADAGTPIVLAQPESEEAAAYRRIATRVAAKAMGSTGPAMPRFVVE
ncbi:Mrp/NBP35 family ATP-binding protein [Acetobacteraceae bacterium H6797]|nr:Mrp/NBP35 family ATP-binding protein [Acetobacteraceae bacterium H6797]